MNNKEFENKLFSVLKSGIRVNEILLVLQRIKPAVRLSINKDERKNIEILLTELNLHYVYSDFEIVQEADIGKGGYSNKGVKTKISTSIHNSIFLYISYDMNIAINTKLAEYSNDSVRFGKFLGYPDCCIDFFIQNSEKQKKIQNDFTIPSILNSQGYIFPYQLNIVSRYFDSSIISHFPCSFNCKESLRIGNEYGKSIKNELQDWNKHLEKMLKSVIIFSEFEGVHIITDYKREKNRIQYDTIFWTNKNSLTEVLKNNNQIIINNKSSFFIGESTINDFYILVFE